MCDPIAATMAVIGAFSVNKNAQVKIAKQQKEAAKAQAEAVKTQQTMAKNQQAKESLSAISARKDEYAARRSMAAMASNAYSRAGGVFGARSFFG